MADSGELPPPGRPWKPAMYGDRIPMTQETMGFIWAKLTIGLYRMSKSWWPCFEEGLLRVCGDFETVAYVLRGDAGPAVEE